MRKTIGREGHTDIIFEKPLIDGGIWFPVSVENGYIEEDGFSFSLPVDDGAYSLITYEKAVGVLAEDTYALIQNQCTKPKSFWLSNYLYFREIPNWANDLPALTDDEEECGFYVWPQVWRDRYESVHYQCESKHGVPILTFKGSALYQTDASFYAKLSGLFCDRVVPVQFDTDMNLALLVSIVDAKRTEIASYNKLAAMVKENLSLLAEVFSVEE